MTADATRHCLRCCLKGGGGSNVVSPGGGQELLLLAVPGSMLRGLLKVFGCHRLGVGIAITLYDIVLHNFFLKEKSCSLSQNSCNLTNRYCMHSNALELEWMVDGLEFELWSGDLEWMGSSLGRPLALFTKWTF